MNKFLTENKRQREGHVSRPWYSIYMRTHGMEAKAWKFFGSKESVGRMYSGSCLPETRVIDLSLSDIPVVFSRSKNISFDVNL